MFDTEDTPDFFDSTTYNTPSNIQELSLIDEKYVVVGERHPDERVADDVIIPLLESGEFDTLMMEAFTQGPVKSPPKQRYNYHKDGVYTWNSEKFDRITQKAEENEVEIYGLESEGARKTERMELADWALQTVKNTDSKTLVVIGSSHSRAPSYKEVPMRREYREEATLEHMLPSPAATVCVSGREDIKEVEPTHLEDGLYSTEEIPRLMPEKLASDKKNFVFLTD